MQNGYISLHRKLIDSPIYSDSQALHLWIHLLFLANHKTNTFVQNGKQVTVNRGQVLTGRQRLSESTKLSESKVQRLLELFVELKMIEQQTNSKNRLISITNYSLYQSSEHQVNNKRTTDEQQVNTNNNDNNVNNDNNLKDIVETGVSTIELKEISKPVKSSNSITQKDLVSIGIDEQIAKDYLTTRKKKLTETSLKAIIREAEKANLSLANVFKIMAEKGWVGFEAKWIIDKQQGYISFEELALGEKYERTNQF